MEVLGLSVNLSALQVQQPGLIERSRPTVEEAGIGPSDLKFEMTESGMCRDIAGTIARWKRSERLRIRIAIDDSERATRRWRTSGGSRATASRSTVSSSPGWPRRTTPRVGIRSGDRRARPPPRPAIVAEGIETPATPGAARARLRPRAGLPVRAADVGRREPSSRTCSAGVATQASALTRPDRFDGAETGPPKSKVCYARNMTAAAPRTIVDKIWAEHVVTQDPGAPAVLAVDLHLVHEVTRPQAFAGLPPAGSASAIPFRPWPPPTTRSRRPIAACRSSTRWPPPRSARSRPTAPSSASRSTASATRARASSTSSAQNWG